MRPIATSHLAKNTPGGSRTFFLFFFNKKDITRKRLKIIIFSFIHRLIFRFIIRKNCKASERAANKRAANKRAVSKQASSGYRSKTNDTLKKSD